MGKIQLLLIVVGGIILISAFITVLLKSLAGKTWLAVIVPPPTMIVFAYLDQLITLGYMDPFFPLAAGNIFVISLVGVLLGLLIHHKATFKGNK